MAQNREVFWEFFGGRSSVFWQFFQRVVNFPKSCQKNSLIKVDIPLIKVYNSLIEVHNSLIEVDNFLKKLTKFYKVENLKKNITKQTRTLIKKM